MREIQDACQHVLHRLKRSLGIMKCSQEDWNTRACHGFNQEMYWSTSHLYAELIMKGLGQEEDDGGLNIDGRRLCFLEVSYVRLWHRIGLFVEGKTTRNYCNNSWFHIYFKVSFPLKQRIMIGWDQNAKRSCTAISAEARMCVAKQVRNRAPLSFRDLPDQWWCLDMLGKSVPDWFS